MHPQAKSIFEHIAAALQTLTYKVHSDLQDVTFALPLIILYWLEVTENS